MMVFLLMGNWKEKELILIIKGIYIGDFIGGKLNGFRKII